MEMNRTVRDAMRLFGFDVKEIRAEGKSMQWNVLSVVKSIVFSSTDAINTNIKSNSSAEIVGGTAARANQNVLVVLNINRYIDIQKLAAALKIDNSSSLRLASREEATRLSGCAIGTIPPLPLTTNMPVVLDQSLVDSVKEIVGGSGDPQVDLVVSLQSFLDRVPGVLVSPISCENRPKLETSKLSEDESPMGDDELGDLDNLSLMSLGRDMTASRSSRLQVMSQTPYSGAFLRRVSMGNNLPLFFNVLKQYDSLKQKEYHENYQKGITVVGGTHSHGHHHSHASYTLGPIPMQVPSGVVERSNSTLSTSAIDIDEPTSVGKTALHLAAWKGSIVQVRELLRRGANLNLVSTGRGNYGKTAIFYAITRCRDEIVRDLIDHGAFVKIVNNKGQTPRSLAVTHLEDSTLLAIEKAEAAQEHLPWANYYKDYSDGQLYGDLDPRFLDQEFFDTWSAELYRLESMGLFNNEVNPMHRDKVVYPTNHTLRIEKARSRIGLVLKNPKEDEEEVEGIPVNRSGKDSIAVIHSDAELVKFSSQESSFNFEIWDHNGNNQLTSLRSTNTGEISNLIELKAVVSHHVDISTKRDMSFGLMPFDYLESLLAKSNSGESISEIPKSIPEFLFTKSEVLESELLKLPQGSVSQGNANSCAISETSTSTISCGDDLSSSTVETSTEVTTNTSRKPLLADQKIALYVRLGKLLLANMTKRDFQALIKSMRPGAVVAIKGYISLSETRENTYSIYATEVYVYRDENALVLDSIDSASSMSKSGESIGSASAAVYNYPNNVTSSMDEYIVNHYFQLLFNKKIDREDLLRYKAFYSQYLTAVSEAGSNDGRVKSIVVKDNKDETYKAMQDNKEYIILKPIVRYQFPDDSPFDDINYLKSVFENRYLNSDFSYAHDNIHSVSEFTTPESRTIESSLYYIKDSESLTFMSKFIDQFYQEREGSNDLFPIGLDCEWASSFVKGQTEPPCGTLQLGLPNGTFIVDIKEIIQSSYQMVRKARGESDVVMSEESSDREDEPERSAEPPVLEGEHDSEKDRDTESSANNSDKTITTENGSGGSEKSIRSIPKRSSRQRFLTKLYPDYSTDDEEFVCVYNSFVYRYNYDKPPEDKHPILMLNDVLSKLFRHKYAVVVGFDVSGDFSKLNYTFNSMPSVMYAPRVLDLASAGGSVLKMPKVGRSLSRLAFKVLHVPMDKTQRMTRWDKRPLTTEQLLYAALDSTVMLNIYYKMIEESRIIKKDDVNIPAIFGTLFYPMSRNARSEK